MRMSHSFSFRHSARADAKNLHPPSIFLNFKVCHLVLCAFGCFFRLLFFSFQRHGTARYRTRAHRLLDEDGHCRPISRFSVMAWFDTKRGFIGFWMKMGIADLFQLPSGIILLYLHIECCLRGVLFFPGSLESRWFFYCLIFLMLPYHLRRIH